MEARIPRDSISWSEIDIYLFCNGQEYSPPRKHHLGKTNLDLWDNILETLARLQYGTIHSKIDLYTLDGKKVTGPLELSKDGTYVAVAPPDEFVQAGYQTYMMRASRSREKRQSKQNGSAENSAKDNVDVKMTNQTNLSVENVQASVQKASITKKYPVQLKPDRRKTNLKPPFTLNSTSKDTDDSKQTVNNRRPMNSLKKLIVNRVPMNSQIKNQMPTNNSKSPLRRNQKVPNDSFSLIAKSMMNPNTENNKSKELNGNKTNNSNSRNLSPNIIELPIEQGILTDNVSIIQVLEDKDAVIISSVNPNYNDDKSLEKIDVDLIPSFPQTKLLIKSSSLSYMHKIQSKLNKEDIRNSEDKAGIPNNEDEQNMTSKDNNQNINCINEGTITQLKLYLEISNGDGVLKFTNDINKQIINGRNHNNSLDKSNIIHFQEINKNNMNSITCNENPFDTDAIKERNYQNKSIQSILIDDRVEDKLFVLQCICCNCLDVKNKLNEHSKYEAGHNSNNSAVPVKTSDPKICLSKLNFNKAYLNCKHIDEISLKKCSIISTINEELIIENTNIKFNNEGLKDMNEKDDVLVNNSCVSHYSDNIMYPERNLDKATQTEWCNLIVQAKLHDDGKYTFHLPPLEVFKYNKL